MKSVCLTLFNFSKRFCSSNGTKIPDPPENCCMSGCDKCVWITYCEELTDLYRDGGEQARRDIDKLVQDPSLKMFLKIELNKLNEDAK